MQRRHAAGSPGRRCTRDAPAPRLDLHRHRAEVHARAGRHGERHARAPRRGARVVPDEHLGVRVSAVVQPRASASPASCRSRTCRTDAPACVGRPVTSAARSGTESRPLIVSESTIVGSPSWIENRTAIRPGAIGVTIVSTVTDAYPWLRYQMIRRSRSSGNACRSRQRRAAEEADRAAQERRRRRHDAVLEHPARERPVPLERELHHFHVARAARQVLRPRRARGHREEDGHQEGPATPTDAQAHHSSF